MRTTLTLAALLVLWIIVISRFGVIRRHRNSPTVGDTASRIWLITVWLGVSLAFQVEVVQIGWGQVTGINNLGWYTAYLCGSIAFYHLSELARISLGWISYRSAPAFVSVLIGLSFLYWIWMRPLPEWPMRSPRIWAESIFLFLYFGYATFSGSLGTISIIQSFRDYETPSLKARSGFAIATAFVALSCFVFKMVYAVAAYFWPDAIFTLRINQAAAIAMVVAVFGFMILFVPHHFVVRTMKLFQALRNLWTLHELRYLQNRLLVLCPPIVWEEPSWWEQLRNLDLHLFRRVISIMDSHRMLSGFLATAPTPSESMVV